MTNQGAIEAKLKKMELSLSELVIRLHLKKILADEIHEMKLAGTGHHVIEDHIEAYYKEHGWALPKPPHSIPPERDDRDDKLRKRQWGIKY